MANKKTMAISLVVICIALLALSGCVNEINTSEFCAKDSSKLSYDGALQIARQNPDCSQAGTLKESHACNSYTGTWWIDIDSTKQGCAPACVINVATKQAEVNWRCTGALPPEPAPETPPEESGTKKQMSENLCTKAGGNWNVCGSRCAIDNQGEEGVACTLQCEELCECGTNAGFTCPDNYACHKPDGIAGAKGYCI